MIDTTDDNYVNPRLVNGDQVATCRWCGEVVTDTDTHICDPTSAEDPPEQDY